MNTTHYHLNLHPWPESLTMFFVLHFSVISNIRESNIKVAILKTLYNFVTVFWLACLWSTLTAIDLNTNGIMHIIIIDDSYIIKTNNEDLTPQEA